MTCQLQNRVAALVFVALVTGVFVRPVTVHGQQDEPRWQRSPERWLDEEPREVDRRPTVPEYLAEMSWKMLPEEVLLIAGSATAWRWDEEKWFSDFRAVNRGFGGSRIDDNTHLADQLILPYRPSTILFYAGDNDLWARKPVDVTVRHFKEFTEKIRAALPETQIVFVSIRPSIARWEIWPAMQEANRGITAIIDADPNLHYADIVPVMLGADGRPRRELLIADDLHLTPLGYLEWGAVVKPIVYAAEERYRRLKGCDRWGCGALR